MIDTMYKKIGEVCTVERGGSPRPIDEYITEAPDGINWIKIGDTDDSMYITHTKQKINSAGVKKSRFVHAGDFLLSNSMSFGRPYILAIDGCIHDGWLVLHDNDNLFDKRFLYYYLSAPSTYNLFRKMAVGGVVNNLNSEMVRNVLVPVPSIENQRRIADTLDKVSEGIDLCRKMLADLDVLVKSQFVEMFGNGKYPVVRAMDVCDFITKGTTPPANEIFETAQADSIPYLKVYNLSFTGDILFSEQPQYISRATHEKLARSKVYPNDVLMNIVGPPLGKFCLVTEQYPEWNINQAIAIFRAKNQVLPKFLMQALMQREVLLPFLEKAQGVRQLNLSLEQCRTLEFALPPIEEQKAYVRFVEQADKSKLAIQQQLSALETLKKSLMQEYFG